MKTLIITGISGSLGSKILKSFYGKYNIIGICRNEYNAWKLKQQYPKVKYMLCDIRTVDIPECDYIINTAAMKHVSSGHDNIDECIDINIRGLQNIVNQAVDKCRIKFIQISSDKAVQAVNVYGATKYIGEEYVLNANRKKPIFNICRFGNLFGSSGTIVEILKNEHEEHKLTDINARRYFITFSEAIKLIKKAMKSKAGSVIYKKCKVMYIIDLIKAIKGQDADYEIVGLRPGEKLMEKMSIDDNIEACEYYSMDEIKELLNE